MTSELSNDKRDADAAHGPDAHGQAAMLLVESLIHGLVAGDVITVIDAVDIVENATEQKIDVAEDPGDKPIHLQDSHDLLKAISLSLSHDIPAD